MKKLMKLVFVFALFISILSGALFSRSIKAHAISNDFLQISAKEGCLIDFESGNVLYEKNADERRPIASMVKIMTLLLCMEEIDKGSFTIEDTVSISQNAASMGGSQAFLDAGVSYKIDDLIKTITIASANDSCVAMAEHISGSVPAFVERMNQRAKELGLENTLFANCTGLPAPEQYSTAKDVGIMLRELIRHKLYFKYSTIWIDKLEHQGGRVTELANTNKLVRFYEGCDGGKTGFTNDAMHCLAATAKRGGMRLVSVIMGGTDSKTRFADSSTLLNYGFANFENKQVVFAGRELKDEICVKKGKPDTVKAAAKNDFFVFGKKGELKDNIKVNEQIFELNAPIKSGDVVGKYEIVKDGEIIGEVEIVALEDVNKISYNDLLRDLFQRLANVKKSSENNEK